MRGLIIPSGAGGGGSFNVSAGTTSNDLTNVVFADGNGVSFGLNGSTVTASAVGGGGSVNLSAGTTSNNLTNFVFANGNGVSFGLDGSTVTGTVQTNYLTTAMASNRGSDFVQANAAFAGTSASGTIASNGISISIGPYITTAMLSNAATLSNIRLSAGTTSNLASAFTFDNGNGVSFGLNAGTITGSHNGITTGRASNDGVGLATAATQVTWTVNSAGISLNAGGYLTTAMLSNAVTLSNIRVSAGTTSNNLSALTFDNAGGVSFGLNGSVITAEAPAGAPSPVNFSAGTTSNNLASVIFANGNGVSFGLNTGASSQSITASHNGITTGRASNDGVGLATAQTNVTWTVNSAGLSFNAGGYAGTGFTSTTTAGTEIKATQNTAGLSMAVPAYLTAAAGGGGVIGGMSNIGNTSGTSGVVSSQIVFVGGDNITLSQSVNGQSATLTISAGAGGAGATLSAWLPYRDAVWVTSGIGNASLWINPRPVEAAFQYDRMVFPFHFSQATNSTLSVSNTVAWGWYSRNANTLSLYKSGSGTFSINGSGTASSANNSGIRVVSFASTDTITAGNYYLGLVWRTSTGGANASMSYIGMSQLASTISGYIGLASNTRMQFALAGGVWTSTTAGPVPNSLALSDIRGNSSAFRRQPICYFTSGEITY